MPFQLGPEVDSYRLTYSYYFGGDAGDALMDMTLVTIPATNSTHLTMACSSVHLTKTTTSSMKTVPCRKGLAGG